MIFSKRISIISICFGWIGVPQNDTNKIKYKYLPHLKKYRKNFALLLVLFVIRICEQKKKRNRKNKDLEDEQMELTEAFLNQSDVTNMNPGRKYNVYIGRSMVNVNTNKSVICCGQYAIYLALLTVIEGKKWTLKSSVMFLKSICLWPSYIITWKAINSTFSVEIFLMALAYAKYMKIVVLMAQGIIKL